MASPGGTGEGRNGRIPFGSVDGTRQCANYATLGIDFFFFTNFANKSSIFIARIIIFVIFVKV